MNEEYDLVAEYREDQGKGASRRLRREGKLPAIVYGGDRPPRAITLDHDKVLQQSESERFYSSVLMVKVGERAQEVILKDIQRHPSKNKLLHLDLQRIVAGEAIRMNVPIHYLNEESAKGVKLEGGVLFRQYNEVEVSCLPKNLPEYIEVDVAELGMDEQLHLSDIKVPEGVEIVELAQEEAEDQIIVSIHMPRQVVEEEEGEEAEEPEAGEVPRVGDEEESEGEDESSRED
ncbi:MAG: 50S ribosomal protein L25/general stress protein Ctc [Gammaproteobacteria bacterium]|jgi:large subunit ribosomal protein L25|nr:50S ribosomal protein L25/general stress protein Ctc [Gammaproteobacteria bacterium]